MNRRGFLKRAVGALGAISLGSNILPKGVKAANPSPTIDISEIEGGEGGYIVPIKYEAVIRRELSEALAISIDKAAVEGSGSIVPRGLLNL